MGLGGVAFRLISFSSKFQTSGVPGRDITVDGRSATMSSRRVSFSGATLSIRIGEFCRGKMTDWILVESSFVGEVLAELFWPSRRMALASERISFSSLSLAWELEPGTDLIKFY